MKTLDLALISHTNVGKTTLARTLLRKDVGRVLDQAHVTELSDVFVLVEADDAQLRLWDTPGFGDSARLLRRLRAEKNPLGWFVHQVWDRFTDRPLWCSQQAARTIRDDADVVLYLVNGAEDPGQAGYVDLELELLSWMERPVLVLLNQVGETGPDSPQERALEQAWREHMARWPVVRGVLSLDAFTTCWVEEGVLLGRLRELLDGEKAATLKGLAAAWEARNFEVFRRSASTLAVYLARAAGDREKLPSNRASTPEKKKAMTALADRLEGRTRELMDALIRDHGLEGRSSRSLEKALDAYLVQGTTALTTQKGALLGGAVSGALGGLAADLMAGGLTFGGGLVAGAILGALGGAGLSRANELVRLGGEPAVRWSQDFLAELASQSLLRYLAVAHFGRGRGEFVDQEHSEPWRQAVALAVESRASELRSLWNLFDPRIPSPEAQEDLAELLEDLLRELLAQAYPAAAESLRRG